MTPPKDPLNIPGLPDHISPTYGWRAWYIDRHSALRSFYHDGGPWPSRHEMAAACTQCRDQSPGEGCRCGVYAAPTRRGALIWAERFLEEHTSPSDIALGEVALWGKVVAHEYGYRAEYAYPTKLWTNRPAQVEALAERYGVPTTYDASLPKERVERKLDITKPRSLLNLAQPALVPTGGQSAQARLWDEYFPFFFLGLVVLLSLAFTLSVIAPATRVSESKLPDSLECHNFANLTVMEPLRLAPGACFVSGNIASDGTITQLFTVNEPPASVLFTLRDGPTRFNYSNSGPIFLDIQGRYWVVSTQAFHVEAQTRLGAKTLSARIESASPQDGVNALRILLLAEPPLSDGCPQGADGTTPSFFHFGVVPTLCLAYTDVGLTFNGGVRETRFYTTGSMTIQVDNYPAANYVSEPITTTPLEIGGRTWSVSPNKNFIRAYTSLGERTLVASSYTSSHQLFVNTLRSLSESHRP